MSLSAAPRQATISKAFVLGIAEYASWGRLPGAGADAKEANNFLDDMGRREDTTVLSGEVTQESLCQELTTWVRDIPKSTDGHERPALICFFSCHSMMNANGWPLLLASDAPRKEYVSETVVFDIEQQLIAPINKIHLDRECKLRVILIFDCCLSPFPGAVHDTWTSRGSGSSQTLGPSLFAARGEAAKGRSSEAPVGPRGFQRSRAVRARSHGEQKWCLCTVPVLVCMMGR